jgi:hypothetical protein
MEFLILNQVGPVLMDKGVKAKAILPAGCEVTDVDIVIAGSLHLAPQQQGVFSRLGLAVVGFFECDVLNLGDKNITKLILLNLYRSPTLWLVGSQYMYNVQQRTEIENN